MARDLPTIPDNKLIFYRKKLWREVSNLFKWEGLPEEIPVDFMENTLVREGRVLFFYDPDVYGYMALRGDVRGNNIYGQPTTAACTAPNTDGKKTYFERMVIHKYDEEIGVEKSGVLINNMYNGESLNDIVDHFAYRLSLVQIAFDTNALWQNKPVTWSVTDDKTKLSIEKWYSDILSGKPLIVVDKTLTNDNKVIGDVINVECILDKLYDAKNEVYNEFKATIGLNTPGADKKERLIVSEVESNNENTETCLEIMLKQRTIAAEEINKVFGLNVSVSLLAADQPEETEEAEETEEMEEGGADNGTGNN